MAGRIRSEDIALVREKTAIADVIGEHVQLRNAGGGNLKGLCPFHDERSPSFNVTPARGMYYCFGCGAGGDVFKFLQSIEHLEFTEVVERLAARANITLRYEDGFTPSSAHKPGQRARLLAAHAEAAAFYAEQLRTPDAAAARDFLTARGFDEAAALRFGCGFAPAAWDGLTSHLLKKGFTEGELVTGGLARRSERGGLIDKFHRRLLWPIKDVSGQVIGFGARRLFEDDRIEAKYLNTAETPIFKKSETLFGLDLAKRDIAHQRRAVIVEGYTDVMACHLAGVTTAVATNGTAFGDDHVRLLRRILLDSDTERGEVIFTFDGDAAGMKAAERAFAHDQKFMANTRVAIAADGMDPCELRMRSGDHAVLDLVAGNIPMVEFVLRVTVGKYDLDTAEGRVAALDRGVPLVAQIKDRALRDEYARRLAGLIGLDDPMSVVRRVRGFERASDRQAGGRSGGRPEQAARPGAARGDAAGWAGAHAGAHAPDSGRDSAGVAGAFGLPGASPAALPAGVVESVVQVEREVLKLAMQAPQWAGEQFDMLAEQAFTLPAHQQLRRAIAEAGGASAASAGPQWTEAVAARLVPALQSGAHALSVEPLHTEQDSVRRYGDSMLARLHEIVAGRTVAQLKSKLQRLNPQTDAAEHARLFAELIALEAYRRDLRERAIGGVF